MNRPTRLLLVAALAAAATVGSSARPGSATDAPTPFVDAAPRSQRVVMFTDSVGLGARHALPRAFPAGWTVNVDGKPAQFVEKLESDFVRPRLATNPDWFGDHVVIAAGYNYPYWDPERFERSIDSMIDTLTAAGVQHIYWVTLRDVKPQYISASAWRQVQPYYWYFPTVNDHLADALTRHPNLTLVDWAAVADQTGLTYDAIHLNNTGAELFSRIIQQAVDGASTRVADGSTTRVSVPGGEGAAAAAFNITTTDPRNAGHLRVHRCDRATPLVAMHNYRRAETVAHSGVVPLDADGDFCIFAKTGTNLVVDVTGLFGATDGFVAIEPTRWLDTRTSTTGARLAAGGSVSLDIDDVRAAAGLGPDDPDAVTIVATATDADDSGWLRVTPCGSDSVTANVNYGPGAATPNLAVVEPDAGGRICITSRTAAHVVVDLFGVFDDTAGVAAARPERLFDSRDDATRVAAGSVTVLDLGEAGVAPQAGGVVLNITSLGATAPGYVTAYPCAAGRPLAANLNVGSARVISNAAIVAPDDAGTVCVYARSEMHLVVDLMGSVGTAFTGLTPTRALDTRG